MSDSDNEEFDSDMSEEYDPEGVTSGDDVGGCCYWSKEQDNMSQYEIILDEYIPSSGHLLELLDDDTKLHDVLEKIMDDTFILSCIEATNEHRANNPNFVNTIGEIAADEKGIYFVCGFFAIKWHIRLLRYPQMKWAWSEDPLKSQPEIKKTMSSEAFRLMLKHFRVVKSSALPTKQSVDYHPLQNINNGVIYLRNRALWAGQFARLVTKDSMVATLFVIML